MTCSWLLVELASAIRHYGFLYRELELLPGDSSCLFSYSKSYIDSLKYLSYFDTSLLIPTRTNLQLLRLAKLPVCDRNSRL